jgi:hypothetical protein
VRRIGARRPQTAMSIPPPDGTRTGATISALGECKHIEWCEMISRGTPDSLSIHEVARICKAIGLEVVADDETVKILGYRRI